MLRGRTAACVYLTDAVKVLRSRKVQLSKKTWSITACKTHAHSKRDNTGSSRLAGRCHCDTIDPCNQGRLQDSVSIRLSSQLHVQNGGLLQVNQSTHIIQA